MIHYVEDCKTLRDILCEELAERDIVCLTHESHEDCKPLPGDVVLHDLNGVGELIKVEGVHYYSVRGCTTAAMFPKPYEIDSMVKILRLHIVREAA